MSTHGKYCHLSSMAVDEEKSAIPDTNQGLEETSPKTFPSPPPGKGKGKEIPEQSESTAEEAQENSGDSSRSTATTSPEPDPGVSDAQPWQAIFSPQYNSYYFYNNQTGETTWTNPLQPSHPTASDVPPSDPSFYPDPESTEIVDASVSMTQYTALQAAALAQGIDPSLAHLDPSLVTATTSASGGPIPTFQAKFNARTGAFTRPDARTPGHLSEYERMKRMSEFYFDVNAWEQEIAGDAAEEEVNGKKRKRPTKKDLERFKEQKRLKKIAKTAWLRT